ncbi:MAG: four helix bundle protein [Eubacteriales bacterium]
MKDNILLEKTMDFAAEIVLLYEDYTKLKKDNTITKQLLRSATSIGANLNEAIYGNSKADFISKLHICLKETSESIYWLKLLHKTKLLDDSALSLIDNAEEIKRILISSLNTTKNNMN